MSLAVYDHRLIFLDDRPAIPPTSPTFALMRYFPYLLLLLLTACAPEPPRPVTTAVIDLRYQKDRDELRADVSLDPDSLTAPGFLGSPMPAFAAAGPGHYRDVRRLPGLPDLRLTLPYPDRPERAELRPTLPAAHLDSLPPVLYRDRDNYFSFGDQPLTENESVELFLEPGVAGGGRPFRLQLQGPSARPRFHLPPPALTDVAPGEYSAYLIRQGLSRDTLPGVVVSVQGAYFSRGRGVRVE